MEFYKIINLIANLATTSMVVFAAYQCVMLKKDYNLKNDKEERAKAIELSRFYADGILSNNINYLFFVFSKTGIDKLLSNLKYNQLKEFDDKELKELIDDKTIDDINNKLKNIDINILALAKLTHIEHCSNAALKEYYTFLKSNSEAEQEVAASNNSQSPHPVMAVHTLKYSGEFETISTNTLNQLEYFCMSFNNGIADEEIVYQSLHQSFLGLVKLLYFIIAQHNISGKDKYYTNIIALFNKWASRYESQEKQEVEASRATTHKKNKIKR